MHKPGPWRVLLGGFAECLPSASNRITLDSNAIELLKPARDDATAMVGLLGGQITSTSIDPGTGGGAVHEMGGASMGHEPATSVLNAHNQSHDIANLFVTDGAAMASTACQNPSLTYMALTARAAATAVSMLKEGAI